MFRIINHRTVRGEELPYGIRNDGGLVCFFTVPTLYYGQEARYKEECDELRQHAETMCSALNQQVTG